MSKAKHKKKKTYVHSFFQKQCSKIMRLSFNIARKNETKANSKGNTCLKYTAIIIIFLKFMVC